MRSVRVLGRHGESVETILFQLDDDAPLTPAERAFCVFLDRDTYLEMGKPEQITVTIDVVDPARASGPVIDDPELETALAEQNIHVGSFNPTHIPSAPGTGMPHAERVIEETDTCE